MIIKDNIMSKMLIQVDVDKISERSAKKLNMILSHYEMELTKDGWYTGTDEHCKSVYTFITEDENIFNCLTKWIWWTLSTNVKEDCIKEHLDFLKKWG